MRSNINNTRGWAARVRAFAPVRKILQKTLAFVLSSGNGVILFYDDPRRSEVFDLIRKIKRESELLLRDNEAYQLFAAVKSARKIGGDIAEVGAYKGGSARLICEVKGEKTLHLFETFTGLPELSEHDDPDEFQKGEFPASPEEVRETLRAYNNVHIYEGLFPQTAEPLRDRHFSLVHLDVDLFEATRDSLEFFYPKLSKGGVLISHDYSNTPGVKKAIDEFFENKPEPIIEISGSQCLVVKV